MNIIMKFIEDEHNNFDIEICENGNLIFSIYDREEEDECMIYIMEENEAKSFLYKMDIIKKMVDESAQI